MDNMIISVVLGVSIASLIVGSLALGFGIVSYVKMKTWENSTHTVQMPGEDSFPEQSFEDMVKELREDVVSKNGESSRGRPAFDFEVSEEDLEKIDG